MSYHVLLTFILVDRLVGYLLEIMNDKILGGSPFPIISEREKTGIQSVPHNCVQGKNLSNTDVAYTSIKLPLKQKFVDFPIDNIFTPRSIIGRQILDVPRSSV
jgi:hypothetical protein